MTAFAVLTEARQQEAAEGAAGAAPRAVPRGDAGNSSLRPRKIEMKSIRAGKLKLNQATH